MIIPPDPEKDPRLFRESTASLITVPEGQLVALYDEPTLPDAAYHTNPATPSPYPYGSGPFGDDMAVAWGNETLPPYDDSRRPNSLDPAARNAAAVSNGLRRSPTPRRTLPHGATLIRTESVASGSSAGSSSSHAGPRLAQRSPSSLPSATSTSVASDDVPKAWEGQTPRRWHGIPLPPRRHQGRFPLSSNEEPSRWHKHKKWWLGAMAIIALAIAVAVGLAVGFSTSVSTQAHKPSRSMQDRPDSHTQINVWAAQCQHLTYEPKRDGPKEEDGVMSACNNFTTFNETSSLTQLAVSSPFFEHYMSTFYFPLQNATNATTNVNSTSNCTEYTSFLGHELFVLARGLAATGNVEFIGSNAPAAVIAGGVEGQVRVDVVARYSKGANLTEVVNVCKLDRPDGSAGVGVFTPKQCDGDSSKTQSLLNPLYTPAFHVIIRLPPSVVNAHNSSGIYLPGINLNLAQMGTRIGSWKNVATVGKFELTADCPGGGVVVDYLPAEDAVIRGGSNTVQGTFNISQRLSINATSGTILANVILNDPNNPNDTSVSVASSLPMPHSATPARRGMGHFPPDPLGDDYETATSEYSYESDYEDKSEEQTEDPSLIAPTHLVNTSFMTNEGFIFVAYLHHPPNIALRSLIASQSGMVDVSMHPNFVGPFALENGWGSIRLPPAKPYPDSGDPADLGRARTVIQGPVGLDNSYFALNGINMTENIQAPNSVTGAALWSYKPKKASVVDVWGAEGRGSSLAALATLGDLQVTFDGQ